MRTDKSFGRVTGKFRHFVGAGAVAEHEHGFDAELTRLLQERATGRIHAAVKHDIRALGFDLGENRFEIGFLVGGAFTRNWIDFAGLQGFFHFVGQAFAVGGLIVDQRDFLAFQFVGNIGRQRGALLVITANGAKYCFEAALGQGRIGGRARNDWDARLIVNFRGRNGYA